MVRARDSRPLPSWNGWIARKRTTKTAITSNGWWVSAASVVAVHSTRALIRSGVSKGDAVWKTTPRLCPVASKASTWFATVL